jgi:hypothetical protein
MQFRIRNAKQELLPRKRIINEGLPRSRFAAARQIFRAPHKLPDQVRRPESQDFAPRIASAFFSAKAESDRGTKLLAARSRSMASRPRQQCINHLGTALAIHIGAYCGLGGCLVLVLMYLHQPSRASNPGLAAYKPPPGTAIQHHLLPSRPESRGVLVVLPAAPATEPETTGRALERPDVRQDAQSMPEPERRPNPALTRKPKAAKELRHETAAQMSAPQPTPCIPGYDGSGAQTRWC